MEFFSIYDQGFARVAACTVPLTLVDPAANAATTLTVARECHDEGVAVAVFPELGLTGYSLEDLVLQDPLLDAVESALE
jgi:NAD+ synthase (glutamine-hydrolysing)